MQWINPVTGKPVKNQQDFTLLITYKRSGMPIPKELVARAIWNEIAALNPKPLKDGAGEAALQQWKKLPRYEYSIVNGIIEYNLHLESMQKEKQKRLQNWRLVDQNKYIGNFYGLTINGLVKLPYNFSKAIDNARIEFDKLPSVRFYSNAEIMTMPATQILELYYDLRKVEQIDDPLSPWDRCSHLQATNVSKAIPIQYNPKGNQWITDTCREWHEMQLQARIYTLRPELHKIRNQQGQLIDGLVNLTDMQLRTGCPQEMKDVIAEAVGTAILGIATAGLGTAVAVAKYAVSAVQTAQAVMKAIEAKKQASALEKTIDNAIAGAETIVNASDLIDTIGLARFVKSYDQVKSLPTSTDATRLANQLGLNHANQIVDATFADGQVTQLKQILNKVYLRHLLKKQLKIEKIGINNHLFMVPFRYPETGVIGGMIVLHRDEKTGELKTIPISSGIPMLAKKFFADHGINSAIPKTVEKKNETGLKVINKPDWRYKLPNPCNWKKKIFPGMRTLFAVQQDQKFIPDNYKVDPTAAEEQKKKTYPLFLDEVTPRAYLGLMEPFIDGSISPVDSPKGSILQSYKTMIGIKPVISSNPVKQTNNSNQPVSNVQAIKDDESSIWPWIIAGAILL